MQPGRDRLFVAFRRSKFARTPRFRTRGRTLIRRGLRASLYGRIDIDIDRDATSSCTISSKRLAGFPRFELRNYIAHVPDVRLQARTDGRGEAPLREAGTTRADCVRKMPAIINPLANNCASVRGPAMASFTRMNSIVKRISPAVAR